MSACHGSGKRATRTKRTSPTDPGPFEPPLFMGSLNSEKIRLAPVWML